MHGPALRSWRLAVIVLAGAGCASLRPTLPAPDAGMERELVTPRSTRCGLSRCTGTFDVGGTRVQVQHQARTMSPEEATGRPRASIGRRAAGAIGGSVRRGLGGTTSSLTVGRGTRTSSIADAPSSLRCDVVWIDEETSYRHDGEDVTEIVRLSQGIDCAAVSTADSTQVVWRVRGGIPHESDSLRAVFDMVNFPEDFAGSPVALERVAAGVTTPYSVTIRNVTIPGLVAIPATQWTFRRRDGTPVGAVLRPRFSVDPSDVAPPVNSAVDIASAADAGERALLRMLGAVLGDLFRSTR